MDDRRLIIDQIGLYSRSMSYSSDSSSLIALVGHRGVTFPSGEELWSRYRRNELENSVRHLGENFRMVTVEVPGLHPAILESSEKPQVGWVNSIVLELQWEDHFFFKFSFTHSFQFHPIILFLWCSAEAGL